MTAPENKDSKIGDLTPRELEVLRLVANGQTNKDIGMELGIAEATAKTHLREVYRKLGINNRTRAALLYLNAAKQP